MRKVFIVNDSGHDFSAAEKFGELIVMSTGLLDKYNLTGMKRRFEPHILTSKPTDYILHTGPSVMSALACSMFTALHGRLNILLWKAEQDGRDCYVYRRIVFTEKN